MDLLDRLQALNEMSFFGLEEAELEELAEVLRGGVTEAQTRSAASHGVFLSLKRKRRVLRKEANGLGEMAAAVAARDEERLITHQRKLRDVRFTIAHLEDEMVREKAYLESIEAAEKQLRGHLRDARDRLPGKHMRAVEDRVRRRRGESESSSESEGGWELPDWRQLLRDYREWQNDKDIARLRACLYSPVAFGEFMHTTLLGSLSMSSGPPRLQAIADRVLGDRPPWRRLEVLLLHTNIFSAFTACGRYIYVGQPLFEALSDDALAFVIGHETAHHDLGHCGAFHRRIASLPRVTALAAPAGLLLALYAAMERKLHSPERECDADLHGLGLALHAGFEGEGCLTTFDVLKDGMQELNADPDIIFGPAYSDYVAERESLSSVDRARVWAWERKTGYLPLVERKRLLAVALEERGRDPFAVG